MKPEWLEWARGSLIPLKDNGLLYWPLRGLGYRLDMSQHCLWLVYEAEDCDKPCKAQSEEVFKAIGFPIKDAKVKMTKEEVLAYITAPDKKTLIDPHLLREYNHARP